MCEYDLVIRSGTVVDGSGAPSFRGDVAIEAGRIVAVGVVEGTGRQEMDAEGFLVTPGFVDIHTHYDGQATWEHRLSPSSGHGVTTVVAGNCGVGFAPCRPEDRDKLIALMEGVEDVPEVVMAKGLPWSWQSFPEYLDALDARDFDIDIAVQIPHSPLRVFAMGERGVNHEASTEADRQLMASLVTEAVRHGAIGVSTSRTLLHRSKDGKPAPSVGTAPDEVLALARGLGAAGEGVFQIVPELTALPTEEMDLIEKVAQVSGRPVSFSLVQAPDASSAWQEMLSCMDQANAAGHDVRAQIYPRPVGVLLGLELSLNPVMNRPSYKAIADRPLAERVETMRNPAFKAQLLAETDIPDAQPVVNQLLGMVDKMFVWQAKPDYAPPAEANLGARARRAGVTPLSLAYDLLLEQDGHAVLYLPGANYVSGTLDEVRTMMTHPGTVLGLGDGGAHYGLICDASFPTFMLTYWARDVADDKRFPLEWVIASLSSRPAETVNLTDRGLIAPGFKADINIIDLDRLTLHAPRPVFDLPSGGRRITQSADGYVATIVNGIVTYRDGTPTGMLPGRLVRGAGYSPHRSGLKQAGSHGI